MRAPCICKCTHTHTHNSIHVWPIHMCLTHTCDPLMSLTWLHGRSPRTSAGYQTYIIHVREGVMMQHIKCHTMYRSYTWHATHALFQSQDIHERACNVSFVHTRNTSLITVITLTWHATHASFQSQDLHGIQCNVSSYTHAIQVSLLSLLSHHMPHMPRSNHKISVWGGYD